MNEEIIMRGFEVVGIGVYVLAFITSLRQKHPAYLGLFFSCNTMIFWDWVYNTKWFFNVVFNENLIALWEIQGERETLAAGLAFVGFYYWVFHLLYKYQDDLDKKFGNKQYFWLYISSMLYVIIFEAIFVNLGVWTYYQKPFFELYGVAWSNMFMNAHLIVGSYLAIKFTRKWGALPNKVTLNLRNEEWWKSFFMMCAAVWSAFWVAFIIQMLWYILAQPWITSPRLF